MDQTLQSKLPCPACGEIIYSWGNLTAQSLQYEADDASFWTKINPFASSVRARRCNNCGNLQMFTDDEWNDAAPGANLDAPY